MYLLNRLLLLVGPGIWGVVNQSIVWFPVNHDLRLPADLHIQLHRGLGLLFNARDDGVILLLDSRLLGVIDRALRVGVHHAEIVDVGPRRHEGIAQVLCIDPLAVIEIQFGPPFVRGSGNLPVGVGHNILHVAIRALDLQVTNHGAWSASVMHADAQHIFPFAKHVAHAERRAIEALELAVNTDRHAVNVGAAVIIGEIEEARLHILRTALKDNAPVAFHVIRGRAKGFRIPQPARRAVNLGRRKKRSH